MAKPIGFGSNFVVIKNEDWSPGDGIFFQFNMVVGVFMTGMIYHFFIRRSSANYRWCPSPLCRRFGASLRIVWCSPLSSFGSTLVMLTVKHHLLLPLSLIMLTAAVRVAVSPLSPL